MQINSCNMATSEKDKHAETIIRNHAMWSVASGAIPVALADLAAVSAVQLDMIRQLCEVYDVDFSVTRGKAMVTAITSAALARVGAASVIKMVPIAGTLVGSVTGGVLAGASSFALGQAFKTHLSSGGTFLDIDAERLKKVYRDQFEKGKEAVRDWQKNSEGKEGETKETKSRFNFDELIRKVRPSGPSTGKKEAKAEGDAVATPTEPVVESSTPKKQASAEKAEFSVSANELSSKLTELAALHGRGLISDADYAATKTRLLESM